MICNVDIDIACATAPCCARCVRQPRALAIGARRLAALTRRVWLSAAMRSLDCGPADDKRIVYLKQDSGPGLQGQLTKPDT
jgi:hypothetical protein